MSSPRGTGKRKQQLGPVLYHTLAGGGVSCPMHLPNTHAADHVHDRYGRRTVRPWPRDRRGLLPEWIHSIGLPDACAVGSPRATRSRSLYKGVIRLRRDDD